MEFHEKLQELRKQKGLTQEELAAQLQLHGCDITRSAVAKINDMLSGMMSIFFLLIFWKVINATRINEYARVTLCERQLRKKNMTDGMIFFLAKNAVKKRKNTIPV